MAFVYEISGVHGGRKQMKSDSSASLHVGPLQLKTDLVTHLLEQIGRAHV